MWKLDVNFKCAMDGEENQSPGSGSRGNKTIETIYQGFALLDAMELFGQGC